MKPVVVLLHGLARTHRSLGRLRRVVMRHGYDTWARTYPSRRMPIGELANTVAEWISLDVGNRPIVGITHSLGGIVARHMADRLAWDGLLMLAPPNSGSRVAGALAGHPLFGWYFGPVGRELREPATWPAPPEPFAVVAGTRGASIGNLPSWMIGAMRLLPPGEPSDGTVTVAETRLPGMSGFAVVDASHTWLMNHPRTHEHVLCFLNSRQLAPDS